MKFWGFTGLASLLASVQFTSVDSGVFVNLQISKARFVRQHKTAIHKMKTVIAGIVIVFGLNSCSMIFGQNNADKIKNEQALKLYSQAQEEDAKGSDGFDKAIELLNEADKIEPQNAMILHERGLIKIHSQLDVEGGFQDLQKSIDFSIDEEDKQIRYNNRGISYMEIGDMEKACEDWTKAGKDGKYYIKEYCSK